MMTLSQLTEFLGWASIINIVYLLLATIVIAFMKETIFSIHSRIFRVEGKELDAMYFSFLSNYKIATLVFIVVPYISLKMMDQ